jgi:YD repeat-containing protein
LFTGGLLISQQDFHINDVSKMEQLESMFTRRYSSKIFRQQISGGTCYPTTQSIDDEFSGQGWSAHFGRLWDWTQFGLPNAHPVLELPNGSRHTFSLDSSFPYRMISRSGWTLSNTHNPQWFSACSPGPDSVCLEFVNDEIFAPNTQDVRDGRNVLHSLHWNYSGTVLPLPDPHPGDKQGPYFAYDRDAAGHVWPREIRGSCTPTVTLNWDNTLLQPTLNSIAFFATGGGPANYTYQYITQNGHKLLERSSTPEGRTYKYDYDPATNELVRITVSTDPAINSSDAVVEYTYANHQFPIGSFFLSSACTRVITQKRVRKSDGTFDIWNYVYPTTAPHIVEATDPKGNKRKVTFQGYSLTEPYVWNVGLILRDESFQGTSTSLVAIDSVYDFKQVSDAWDPEASNLDRLKIPVLLTSTKTYSQTGQQVVTSYGTAANYDRYGNPDFRIEKNFDGTTLRTTEYEYEYRDGDGDDALMEEANYVKDVSKVTVRNSAGVITSQVSYEHYNTVPDVRIGAVQNVLTWDSETGTNIRKTYDYTWRREVDKIYEETEGADWLTESWGSICNGKTFWWTDALNAEAGGPWSADLDAGTWVYTAHNGESFEPPTNFSYDSDIRLTQITPPSGDATVIDYDDTNRKVTVTQGSASSVENYDHLGRLTKRETKITSLDISTQTFEYDSLNNLIQQSEKTLGPSPEMITKAYDALNRVTSITTVDGTTTYAYTGPDVTITVQSELGNLITTMKYDAGGRLIKVVEPNGKGTTYAYDASDRLIRVCHDDNDDICAAGHAFRRDFVYSTRGKLLSETHPESGTTTYKYDKQGRMIEKKFAGKASPIQYTYDPRGRILTINYPNDPDVSFYYDGDVSSRPIPGYETEYYEYPRGHLTGMVDATGVTIWKYFNVNRQLTRKDLHLTGITNPIVLEYAYDTRNNLQSITYPSGQIVKNYRNDVNAINQITRKFGTGAETNLLTSAAYNAALLPSNLTYGNGVVLGISSDLRNRPDVMNSTGKLTLDYHYNARGLIDQIGTGQNGGPTQLRNIEYDNLGRITKFHSDVALLTYNYDIFGNLTSKTGPISAGPFTYSNNRINGVSYSSSGNQLAVNGKTLVYNQENRVVQVTDASTNTFYSYDGQGNRVKSFDALTGLNEYFIYDEAGGLLAQLSQRTGNPLYIDKEYVQGPTGTIAIANHDETPRGLKVYDLNGKIHLEWIPNTNCPIAGYNVYRSNTQNGTYTLLNTSGPITTAYFDDANVTECTTYWYQIKTVYTGGAIGPASSKISHQFKNLRAVFYNSPSPSPAPLTETFTYNKAGGCPSVNASNYNIDFGDGFVQNFSTPGTVNRNYTTGSSCYPFCVAKLTVTFTNGVIATQRRLVNMSTNLVADENFNDNVADGFTVQSGTWSAASQTYTGSSTGTAWGITTSSSSCNNCVIAAQANTANQTNKNAYIIFGYIDSNNFQYAGYEIASPNRWVIGDVVNNVNTVRASFNQTLATGVWHSLEVKLEASSKTVTLKGNGVTRCMFTFTNLYSLPIGFAVKGLGQSSFDNFKIAPAYTVTSLHNENFDDVWRTVTHP